MYEQRLKAGIAHEQARKDLPLSTFTEAYWKIDLHNLLHFLELRVDAHAQKEIRAYATVIGDRIVHPWVPLTWEAFLDYRLNPVRLSRLEKEVVAALNRHDNERAVKLAGDFGWLRTGLQGLKPNRERGEMEAKLRDLQLVIPWQQ